MKSILLCFVFLSTCISFAFGQYSVSGKIFDDQTKEPLVGANIIIPGTNVGISSDLHGRFTLFASAEITEVEASYVGFEKKTVVVSSPEINIPLTPLANNLQQVVVTASREASLRTESPIAISKLSAATIEDTKPVLITELINKIPGVVMLNYNNEQHGMAIRQPMGTSAYFLYMEDGMPVRPMGIFNHNALIEMNIFSISSIEVVKGPASSLYGPEAVGGAINFITHRPTAIPTVRVGLQADQWGYKRLQYGGGGMVGKNIGIYLSGFEARQKDSWQTFSDYNKSSINGRVDYRLSGKTGLTLTFSGNEYHSDMSGSVDSLAFYNRRYTSTTDFTYRKVHSQRTRITVNHQWNPNKQTTFTLGYRDNYIEQNPNYSIRWSAGNNTATGEINRNTFSSKVVSLQHSVGWNFLETRLLAGGMVDISPTNYWAYRIDLAANLRPDGKSVESYHVLKTNPDIFLSRYKADLKNTALYSQFEITPIERLKVTLGIRYDKMFFEYINYLSNTSGTKSYEQITPKIGATYDLQNDKGLYFNYSQGFSPPALTAIFRKKPSTDVSAPAEFYYNLQPAQFDNFEIGGWASFLKNKLYVDVAAYQMIGRRELLTVRQPDNSTDYQSAGKTLHRGIEYGVTLKPTQEWLISLGGTNALHRFEKFDLSARSTDEIKNVDGNDMAQSPRWIGHAEFTYRPRFLQGFRASLEWQRIGPWYQDQVNTLKYDDAGFLGLKGVSYLNLRAGYSWKGIELFTNITNLTNELYANSAVRGNSVDDRTAYTPGAPRCFVFGIQYCFSPKTPN